MTMCCLGEDSNPASKSHLQENKQCTRRRDGRGGLVACWPVGLLLACKSQVGASVWPAKMLSR